MSFMQNLSAIPGPWLTSEYGPMSIKRVPEMEEGEGENHVIKMPTQNFGVGGRVQQKLAIEELSRNTNSQKRFASCSCLTVVFGNC